jgi:hypothetical protein
LLIVWVGVASLPFLFLDSYHQGRIIYDLPIPILMSSALIFLLPAIGTRSIHRPGIILLVLILTIANYALRGILPL